TLRRPPAARRCRDSPRRAPVRGGRRDPRRPRVVPCAGRSDRAPGARPALRRRGVTAPSGRAWPCWLAPGDVNGFLALALDNVTNLVILSSLLICVFASPPDLVLFRMVPGPALGVP